MAVATDILEAVKAALEAEFPGVPAYVRRHGVARDVDPFGGFNAGDKKEVFVVSAAGPEPVDTAGTFELVSVRYEVRVDHVRRCDPKWGDGDPVTPAVREVRDRVRRALYKPASAVPGVVSDARFRSGEPYGVAPSGALAANVSTEFLPYLAWEPRASS